MFSRLRGKSANTKTAPAPPSLPKPDLAMEDTLRQLSEYEVMILIDDSGSMGWQGRWKDAERAMIGMVEKAVEYDKNGIDIRFLNSQKECVVTKREEVQQLFTAVQPGGKTPLGIRLGNVCNPYLRKYERQGTPEPPKRLLVIVITDGAPDSQSEVDAAIKCIADRLDELGAPRLQLGIQFVQIGNDSGATKFLEHLDDELKGEGRDQLKRDIVDTVPYHGGTLTPGELVKILAGAINKKVDG